MRALACLALPLVLSACISERSFESEPVVLQSDRGPVTCQLYGINQVMLDRALTRPAVMSDEEANAICRAEGYRLLAGAGPARP
ncbi:hypothetical protein E2L08_16110 [Palleronia sediminis]|uniref:Lipoprotein n=1 Tax=Palleronia sediminis TaxID=2547833 RepID=A0A4R6A0X6_9RHOB|nr:hypothetical protein [Palleronia sediminis]TDL74233.1 hypothetical protein E2L08_16110 [Palleronia sediminis]